MSDAKQPEQSRPTPIGVRGEAPETLISDYGDGSSIADLVSASPDRELTEGDPTAALPSGFERYRRRDRIGLGGMGEVISTHDLTVGRNVAMKVVRPGLGTKTDLKSRFLLEARVQGQLEHPSIVPVYDLGVDPEGQLFFTMKQVRGQTLEQVLGRLSIEDEATVERFTRRRLLADFSKLCMAVQFVHEHGVLHRDLKPANVMLGDYGEVYLLDWGLAKLTAHDLAGVSALDDDDKLRVSPHVVGSAPAKTEFGSLVGTPGYMAPEQVLKQEDLDPRADVYGLGAILFEILTGQRLHKGKSTSELVESTLTGNERRPSVRAPHLEIPPELETLVADATAPRREDRLATARELHGAIEGFLDGDRDVARRREAAAAEVDAASTLVKRAVDGGDDQARSEALRRLGHALALDPDNADALRTLVHFLTEPPQQLPESVAAELVELEEQQTRGAGKVGAVAFLSLNLYFPLMFWMGVKVWLPVLLFSVLTTATAAISFGVSRLKHPRTGHAMAVLVAGLATAGASSALFGPFVLAPSIVAVITLLFSLNHPAEWRGRILGLGVAAALLPAVLEWIGLVPPSIAFGIEGMTLLPRFVNFPVAPSLLLLVVGNLAVVITAGAAMAPIRKELDDAQARVRTTAWQLRQMVPEGVKTQTDAHRALAAERTPAPRSERASNPPASARDVRDTLRH